MATLFIVPTPIGNLGDITRRSVDILKSTKIILSEDTRVTKKLMKLLEINYSDKRFIRYFEHNEEHKISEIINLLELENDIALVSDAGTPIISDPGYKLVREVKRANCADIAVLPGATSVTTALVASTFPPDKFTYLGFLSKKTGEKEKLFKSVIESHRHIKSTYIAFESGYRILKTLKLMQNIYGENVQVALCRELTKLHESVELGACSELIDMIEVKKLNLKGELVLVFNILEDKNG